MNDVVNAEGAVKARVGLNPPRVESEDAEVAAWATRGCPALRGAQKGDLMTEEETLIPPTSDLWGLAVLNEIDRRGWEIR